jgi:TetR/AcrR family transcriptional regulator, transcriptional repressor for nem operon
MRYDKGHKQATRQRILEAAGRRFKQDGIDGAGVAVVMSDAGLTNGAFYAHFASKEDLVASVVEEELRLQSATLGELAPGVAGVEQLVRAYLSPEHRDHRETGCPSAALLDEISRCPDPTKQAYTDGVLGFIDDFAAILAPEDPKSARVKTLSIYALMVGTMQLSRAIADPELADQILEQGIQNALTLLAEEPESAQMPSDMTHR